MPAGSAAASCLVHGLTQLLNCYNPERLHAVYRQQLTLCEVHIGNHYQKMQRWSQVWYEGVVMNMTMSLTA